MPTGLTRSTAHWVFRFFVFFFDCEAGGGERVGSMGLIKRGTYERAALGFHAEELLSPENLHRLQPSGPPPLVSDRPTSVASAMRPAAVLVPPTALQTAGPRASPARP